MGHFPRGLLQNPRLKWTGGQGKETGNEMNLGPEMAHGERRSLVKPPEKGDREGVGGGGHGPLLPTGAP